jgi:hypothetical protein
VEETIDYYESLLGVEEGESLDVEAYDGIGGGQPAVGPEGDGA